MSIVANEINFDFAMTDAYCQKKLNLKKLEKGFFLQNFGVVILI